MMKKLMMISFGAAFLFSCTDSDDCHECHIAWENSANEEVEVEIGEFCGADLSDVESNGYDLADTVIVGNDTIPAGTYPGTDIHCEEHDH